MKFISWLSSYAVFCITSRPKPLSSQCLMLPCRVGGFCLTYSVCSVTLLYVVGIELATNWANGRSLERMEGQLKYLKPGGSRAYNLEIGVLNSREEIAELEARIQEMTS